MMPADTASRSARRFFCAGLCLALALAAAPGASAQTDRFPNLWSTDARVEGMAVLGDTLFATGLFTRVGPPTGQVAVLDKTTGEADPSYPAFDALSLGSAGITDIVPDGQGGYYVGGEFSSVAEQLRRNLARVLPDGTLDPDFRPAPQFVGGASDYFGAVTALTLDPNAASPSGAGVLYVGGQFNTVAGQTRQNLAALDAATGEVLPLQATFAYPSTTSYPPRVESLLVHEGMLYVGGIFEQVSGQPHTGLVALDAVTGAVLPWRADLAAENPNFFSLPYALSLGDGTLYLTGIFVDFVNGQPREGIAEVALADPVTG